MSFAIVSLGEAEINEWWNLFQLAWTSLYIDVRNYRSVKKGWLNKIKNFFNSLHNYIWILLCKKSHYTFQTM